MNLSDKLSLSERQKNNSMIPMCICIFLEDFICSIGEINILVQYLVTSLVGQGIQIHVF